MLAKEGGNKIEGKGIYYQHEKLALLLVIDIEQMETTSICIQKRERETDRVDIFHCDCRLVVRV